jgi:hypothetical protein
LISGVRARGIHWRSEVFFVCLEIAEGEAFNFGDYRPVLQPASQPGALTPTIPQFPRADARNARRFFVIPLRGVACLTRPA